MSPRNPKFRFYLDENFPAPAGKFLQSLGHNVVYSAKKNSSLTDLGQLRIANRENRVFLALDKDFISNKSLRGTISHGSGVVLVRSSDPTSEKVIQILEKFLDRFGGRSPNGIVCTVSIDKLELVDPLYLDAIDLNNQ